MLEGLYFLDIFSNFHFGAEYISINYVTSKTSASLRSPHFSRNFVRKKIYKTSLHFRLKFTAHNLCRTYTRSFYTFTYFCGRGGKKQENSTVSKSEVEQKFRTKRIFSYWNIEELRHPLQKNSLVVGARVGGILISQGPGPLNKYSRKSHYFFLVEHIRIFKYPIYIQEVSSLSLN